MSEEKLFFKCFSRGKLCTALFLIIRSDLCYAKIIIFHFLGSLIVSSSWPAFKSRGILFSHTLSTSFVPILKRASLCNKICFNFAQHTLCTSRTPAHAPRKAKLWVRGKRVNSTQTRKENFLLLRVRLWGKILFTFQIMDPWWWCWRWTFRDAPCSKSYVTGPSGTLRKFNETIAKQLEPRNID